MNKPLVFLLALASSAFALDPTPNDQARFLAGLPQDGSPLAGLAHRGEFNSHAKELDAAWADAEERQLRAIREWAPLNLPEAVSDPAPLLYVFSGPDFLHAHTFFPNASTYVLAAVEPVGQLPDVTKLSEGELGASLRNLRNTLNASLSFSFFITADMKKDLQATKLTGTLPVLYVFLARCGCFIQSVEHVWLDAAGKVLTDKETKTPGARITFLGAGGQAADALLLRHQHRELGSQAGSILPALLRHAGRDERLHQVRLLSHASQRVHHDPRLPPHCTATP
jgi:hypothetical protein